MSTMSLRCKACGGILDINDDREIAFCPYCGSKELIIESDDVKKERIKRKTEKEITLGSKEIEREAKKDEYEHDERDFKMIILCFGIAALFVIFLFVMAMLVN